MTSATPLFELFKMRAEAVSAEVHRFRTRDEADTFIAGMVMSEGGTVVSALEGEVTREAAAEAKIGISAMDYAIADTGTLVQDATAVGRRLVSTLPEILVAIVGTDSIVPDLASALARFNPRQIAYLAMITGPSRTADIERVLTIGVHGPSRLVVVFVDEFGGGTEVPRGLKSAPQGETR